MQKKWKNKSHFALTAKIFIFLIKILGMNNFEALQSFPFYSVPINNISFWLYGLCIVETLKKKWDEKRNVLFIIHCYIIIGHESKHWLPLSLTDSCLVDLIDVTLACEDAISKLVEVFTVADAVAEEHVDCWWQLVQIWSLS